MMRFLRFPIAISVALNASGASNSITGDRERQETVSNDGSLVETVTGPRRNAKLNARKKAFKKVLGVRKMHTVPHEYHRQQRGLKGRAQHMVSRDDGDVSNSTTTIGSWSVGEWGACQVNCGTGSQYRSVDCEDGSGIAIDASNCDPVAQPANRQTCTGDCLQCTANTMFLKGLGATDLLETPSHKPSDISKSLCGVTSDFTCCSGATETQLLIGHYQLSRGLKAQTQHRDVNKDLVQQAYQNISVVLGDRISDTDNAIESINEAIGNEPDSKTGDILKLDTLRQSLLSALEQRSDMLSGAVSDIASLESAVMDQLDLMDSAETDDDSNTSIDDSVGGSSSTSSSFGSLNGLFTQSSGIGSALAGQFDDTLVSSVASLSPSSSFIHFDPTTSKASSASVPKRERVTSTFLEESSSVTRAPLNFSDPTLRVFSKACTEAVSDHFMKVACSACNPSFPITTRVSLPPVSTVSTGECSILYNACSDSLVAAHQRLSEGMQSLVNSQSNLQTQVSLIQPILQRVWSEISFDWLPGFSAVQLAQPDLTKMSCVSDILKFVPNQVSNASALCTQYFTFASPKAFTKRVGDLIDRGLLAMATFAACDKCLHKTINFLTELLSSSSKSSLSVTLPTKAKAMIASCSSSSSSPSAASTNGSTSTVYGKLSAHERVSPVVTYASSSSQVSMLSSYQNFSKTQVDAASQAPPSEWTMRTLALDRSNTKFRPLPVLNNTLTYVSADSALQLSIMNRNCTSHAQCWDQSAPTGMRPWWFCAHPNACTSQPGSCSEEAINLLLTGPKCARGPCSSDLSAVDKQCPVNAICPAETGSVLESPTPYFGQQYFSKFDLKMRSSDPANPGSGVCDCALSSSGAVIDQCQYARCLAYASLIENTMTCNAGLVDQCKSILSSSSECASDATLSCTDQDIILSYPPAVAGQCGTSSTALADQTSGSSTLVSVSVLAVVAILTFA